MFLRRRVRIVRRRRMGRSWTAAQKKHYAEHKEAARTLCHERLEHFNRHYNLQYNRLSIKNTRSRWGSCSSKKNLNFNYRIVFLPAELQDYLIVHELCHLAQMNHAQVFWDLVSEQVPNYVECVKQLRAVESDLMQMK
jgi:predicted metal-dependent hydrolase